MISRETAEIGVYIVAVSFMLWITVQFAQAERQLTKAEAKAEALLQKVPDEDREGDYKRLQDAFEQRHEELCIAVVAIRILNDRLRCIPQTDSEREEDAKQAAAVLQALVEKYDVTVYERTLPTLASNVSILVRLVPDLVNPEFVATVLQCDEVEAAKAIGMSAENDAKELS